MGREVKHFASLQQARESLRALILESDAHVQPWQEAIRAHDYFRHDSGCGFPIYCRVMEEEEERPSYLRHFRFCCCYSVACPDGELGDVHVALGEAALSREQFDEAKARGWRP